MSRVEDLITVSNFIGTYPPINDPYLQYNIANKKEFRDLALGKFENRPTHEGNFRHQVIIERFLL